MNQNGNYILVSYSGFANSLEIFPCNFSVMKTVSFEYNSKITTKQIFNINLLLVIPKWLSKEQVTSVNNNIKNAWLR